MSDANDKNHVPTPDEIARACAEIQLDWSPAEHLRRAGIESGRLAWLPPGAERVVRSRGARRRFDE